MDGVQRISFFKMSFICSEFMTELDHQRKEVVRIG